ncbi:MAG: trypsin-like peptidase domain-containing protein [Pseudomonadota bacterium]|mgnify:CR=1 FL=1
MRKVLPAGLLVAVLGLAGFPALAGDEEAFDVAKHYTVKVRARVELPFFGDHRGTYHGAGFVVDTQRGWILTNAHVVARSPSVVHVSFRGGDYIPVTKLYVDPVIDFAVLEIPAKHRPARLPAATLDCAQMPAIGHVVGAFGHPWNLSYTGTRGIISGITSKFAGMLEMLQTDAPINPGNSGGPLISLKSGKVVGINTAVRRGSQNTNFAVPMVHACHILTLLRQGKDPSPPELGMAFVLDIDEANRLVVARVYKGANGASVPHAPRLDPIADGPTAGDALHEGDVIRSVNRDGAVENKGQLIHRLRGHLKDATLHIQRDKRDMDVRVTLRPVVSTPARGGIHVSGALFADMPWVEMREVLDKRMGLMVHYIEPGSAADAQQIRPMDMLLSVDGQPAPDIDTLHRLLTEAEKANRPARIKLLRLSDIENNFFVYVERPMPVTGLRRITGGNGPSS